jgi:hypothetical protein
MRARLELMAPAARLALGAKVRLSIRVSNTGATDLWLNRRLALSSPHAPPSTRDVWLDVIGPDRRLLPFVAKLSVGLPGPDLYQLLRRGEQLTRELPVASVYDWGRPGAYTIQAHLQDGNDSVPPAPQGAVRLAEEIISAPLELTIVGGS